MVEKRAFLFDPVLQDILQAFPAGTRRRARCGLSSWVRGLAELLHGVERLGSLRQAAAAMEMSYSKAWTHVRRAEQICGAKLTRPAAGGEGGGGSQLTEEGQWLLDTYDAFVKEADEQVKQLMERYFTRDLPFS
jgi:molybdate transport repressor ModE-like protein